MDRDQGAALPPVTDWFYLEAQEPWVPGVYEVEWACELTLGGKGWSFWDGINFLGTSWSADRAEPFGKSFGPTRYSITRWRGLSADPAAPQPRYVHETWAEAVARVPALAAMDGQLVGTNASQVFDLADTRPGYQLLTFVDDAFVFRRAGV